MPIHHTIVKGIFNKSENNLKKYVFEMILGSNWMILESKQILKELTNLLCQGIFII